MSLWAVLESASFVAEPRLEDLLVAAIAVPLRHLPHTTENYPPDSKLEREHL